MNGPSTLPVAHDDREPRRSPRRVKYSIMLGIAVASALALLGWTQTWYELVLVESAEQPGVLLVSGQVAAPAVSALALSGLALAAALSIAGPVLRVVFGVLQSMLGASVILSVVLSELDPVTAGAPVVSQLTGITGTDSVHALVVTASSTLWPLMTLAAGALMLAAGILVIATLRRWPASSQRYQSVRLQADRAPSPEGGHTAAEDPSATTEPVGLDAGQAAAAEPDQDLDEHLPDPVDAWDELSRGADPTTADKPNRHDGSDGRTG